MCILIRSHASLGAEWAMAQSSALEGSVILQTVKSSVEAFCASLVTRRSSAISFIVWHKSCISNAVLPTMAAVPSIGIASLGMTAISRVAVLRDLLITLVEIRETFVSSFSSLFCVSPSCEIAALLKCRSWRITVRSSPIFFLLLSRRLLYLVLIRR